MVLPFSVLTIGIAVIPPFSVLSDFFVSLLYVLDGVLENDAAAFLAADNLAFDAILGSIPFSIQIYNLNVPLKTLLDTPTT